MGENGHLEYYKEIRKYVGHKPLILPGAVVCIINEKNDILLQQRPNGTWGLPGGLMDLGESMEETARREVKEETGLNIGELILLGVFSGEEFFVRIENGDEFYALTVVYMTRDYDGTITIDEKESMDMNFFSLKNLPKGLKKEYKSFIEPYIESLQK